MRTHRRRESRAWYVFSRVVVVGAIVWFGLGLLLGWMALNRQVESFARVPLPGDAELSFTEPGGYVVYLEGPATQALGFGPAFEVTVTPVGGSEQVPLGTYGPAVSYSFGGHDGSAVGTFQIDRPGRYVVRADRIDEGPPANIAVGRGLRPAIVQALVGAFALPVLVLAGGIARAVTALVRRAAQGRVAHPVPPVPGQPNGQPDGRPDGQLETANEREELR